LSPFEKAAVLTVDGVGEAMTTGLYLGEGSTLEFLERLEFPHSLELLHAAISNYLGFDPNDDGQQVMDLAAYGQPRYLEKFARVLRTHPDGSFELREEFLDLTGNAEALYSPTLERSFGPPGLHRGKFGPLVDGAFEDPDSQRFADIAASLQSTLERALLGLARRARARTRTTQLCLRGGAWLNTIANARFLSDTGFEEIFIQPAAGRAVGAALLGALGRGDPRPQPLSTLALGLPLARERARALGREMGLVVSELTDPVGEAAERIKAGQILGFAQGRTELGSSALGQRSILCRPDSLELKDRLQRVIEHCEPYRPFAAAVLESNASDYFEVQPNAMAPYLTRICRVSSKQLGGIVHVDGTARLQVVPERGTLAPLLRALKHSGLPPVVLNAPLKAPDEPIASSEIDVLAFFAASALDALILEDLLIQRSPAKAARDGFSLRAPGDPR